MLTRVTRSAWSQQVVQPYNLRERAGVRTQLYQESTTVVSGGTITAVITNNRCWYN